MIDNENFALWKRKTNQKNKDFKEVYKIFEKKYIEFKEMGLSKDIIEWYLKNMMIQWGVSYQDFYQFLREKCNERGKTVYIKDIENG